MLNVQLAASPINWSSDDDQTLGGDISFEQCIFEMQAAGFQASEIGHKYPKDAKVLKNYLNEQNFQISSAWFSSQFCAPNHYDKTLYDFSKFMSFMRGIGAKVINVCECYRRIYPLNQPIFGDQHKLTEHEWQLLVQGLHDIGRLAYEFDMQISYHFHLGTVIQTQDDIDRLMQSTCPDLVGLLLDTGHSYALDINPIELIKTYSHRINMVHLKDIRTPIFTKVKQEAASFLSAVKSGLFTTPGDGDHDFQQILLALRDIDYQGWLVVEAEQDPNIANPLVYAKNAHNYLNGLIRDIKNN